MATTLPPSIFPSIRVFSNESVLQIRWPKYWSFSFSISPSNGYSGLISFKIDWFDPLAFQGTLKSLLQHHKSVLLSSAFFMVQLSHPHMTAGKTIADANRDLKCTVELVPLWFYCHYRRTCSGLSASHRRRRYLWSWSICSMELRPADPEMHAWEWITSFKSHSVGMICYAAHSEGCWLTHSSLKKAVQEWQSLAFNTLLETQAFAASLLCYL